MCWFNHKLVIGSYRKTNNNVTLTSTKKTLGVKTVTHPTQNQKQITQ